MERILLDQNFLKMMKLLLIVVSLAVVINGDFIENFVEGLKRHATNCKDEVGATLGDVQQFIDHVDIASPNGKCLLACVGKKIEWLDESGQIDAGKIRGTIEKFRADNEGVYEKEHTIIEKCIDETQNEESECNTAANLFSCILRKKRQPLSGAYLNI